MNIVSIAAGALALLATAVPSVALAQQPGYPYAGETPYGVVDALGPTTTLSVVPPAYGSVYLYEGRRLVARLDGPGALWLPTGRIYRVVAMRGDQVIWNGNATTAGAPVELRWPAPAAWTPQMPCPYAYPRGPLTAPIERGRVRTPLP